MLRDSAKDSMQDRAARPQLINAGMRQRDQQDCDRVEAFYVAAIAEAAHIPARSDLIGIKAKATELSATP